MFFEKLFFFVKISITKIELYILYFIILQFTISFQINLTFVFDFLKHVFVKNKTKNKSETQKHIQK